MIKKYSMSRWLKLMRLRKERKSVQWDRYRRDDERRVRRMEEAECKKWSDLRSFARDIEMEAYDYIGQRKMESWRREIECQREKEELVKELRDFLRDNKGRRLVADV